MHGGLPPIQITGPDDLLAFDGLPNQRRPAWAAHRCSICRGHGEWNDQLFGGGRVIVKPCSDCNGAGWVGDNGEVGTSDIIMVDGHPRWVSGITKRP